VGPIISSWKTSCQLEFLKTIFIMIDIFNAMVHSDQDKLLEYHCSPGNGLPSDVVFFAVVMKNIEMIEFLLKYDWDEFYLNNFKEEERMKIRDFLQLKRAD